MQISNSQEKAIVEHGWRFVDDLGLACRYGKGGLDLCLFQYRGFARGEGIRATVKPRQSATPDLGAPFTCQGQGAKKKAIALARTLWEEHSQYLGAVGIVLEEVSVFQHVGQGSGSKILAKNYNKSDLF